MHKNSVIIIAYGSLKLGHLNCNSGLIQQLALVCEPSRKFGTTVHNAKSSPAVNANPTRHLYGSFGFSKVLCWVSISSGATIHCLLYQIMLFLYLLMPHGNPK